MRPFLSLALGIALFAPALSLAAAKPKLPPPDTQNSKPNRPKIVPRPEGASFRVPPGFKVENYASGFKKPRFLLELPGGQVVVTEAIPNGGVYLIENGKPGKALLSGLDRPFGMALWGGYLYVGEPQSIKRYRFNSTTLEVGPGEEVVALTGYTAGHWTRAITFDKKGVMFVGVGSGSNVSAGDPADRAAVLVANPDGTNRGIFAGGLRNPVSLRVHPVSGKLWASVQERDGLGDNLVPDFFTEVKQGAFYGWPWAYIGRNEEPRRKGENPALIKKTIVPNVLLPAHVAVMDFVFYTGSQFPAQYRNGAFLAYRGSSNRSKRVGYSVDFLPFQAGKPAGKPERFLAGFMLGEDQPEVWGRPVGLVQLADGSLLLSEDGNNTIYRISYSR